MRTISAETHCIVVRRGLGMESAHARALAVGEEVVIAPCLRLWRVVERLPGGAVAVVPA